MEAEFWAIRDGLQLAADINLTLLHVEMDCTTAIQLLMGNKEKRHQLIAFIHDCRYLARRLGVTSISHAYQEGSKCTDMLANSFLTSANFSLLYDSPFMISQLLHYCNGLLYPRTISIS